MHKEYKLRIAWFSELFAADSLSAYFSRNILPYLIDKFDITLYHNSFDNLEDFPTFHYLKAFEHDLEKPYDIFFYQLEDDRRLNFVRSHIGLIPGITYFHHFNLSNYGPEPLLNSPYTDIVQRFNMKSGDWPARDAKYKPKGPAAFREAALSPVSVFSNPHSLDEYRRLVTCKLSMSSNEGINAFYLPYPVEVEEDFNNQRSEVYKIAYIGSTRIENRAHKVLSSLSNLKLTHELVWIVPPGEEEEAASLVNEFNLKNVQISDNYTPAGWSDVVRSADCAIHTLFSAYGHNDPYLGISMSFGKACIVSNFASCESLPDNLVFKVQPGEMEAQEMCAILSRLINKTASVDSNLLRSFCGEFYDPRQVASELASIFIRRRGYLSLIREEWRKLSREARDSLLEESEVYLKNTDSGIRPILQPVFEELGWAK